MSPKQPRRAWQRMLSGRRLDLLNPSRWMSKLKTSPTALPASHVGRPDQGRARLLGRPHCVLVERLTTELNPRLAREVRLMALLHDAIGVCCR